MNSATAAAAARLAALYPLGRHDGFYAAFIAEGERIGVTEDELWRAFIAARDGITLEQVEAQEAEVEALDEDCEDELLDEDDYSAYRTVCEHREATTLSELDQLVEQLSATIAAVTAEPMPAEQRSARRWRWPWRRRRG